VCVLVNPNPRPNMMYVWKVSFPRKGWRYSQETMAKLDAEGRNLVSRRKNGISTQRNAATQAYLTKWKAA